MRKYLTLISLIACALMPTTLQATCQSVNVTYLQSSMGDMISDNASGWAWDSHNYAKCRIVGGGEAHLITPTLNLSEAEAVTLSFKHTHKFGTNLAEEFTLWVTDNYQGSYTASSWQELTIGSYASNNDWNFVDVSITVPLSKVGANTAFCFRYISTASNNGTWEVKNLHIEGSCPESNDPPVALPIIGDGRLKICAQNLQNYYYNYNNGRGDYTREEFAAKTRKIVDAMLWVDADIYAFCELEAKPIILTQLADSMNARLEGTPYVAASDDIDDDWTESCNCNLKSGFIYRTDKVRPIGNGAPVYGANYYKNTMRVQAFEELSSGERLTLSMNHFKAKDSSDDAGNGTRVTNATRLTENLPSLALDPDILILGDLNCEVGEEPLNIILNAGYEEQLLKYNNSPYSHCYGGGELIDHVYANPSMAAQITGAGLFHISTGCGADASANANHRYSDHDPYVVAVNLLSEQSDECIDTTYSYLATGGTGLGDMRAISMSGQWNWQYDSQYGAKCQDKGGEDWLLTPEYNLTQASSVSLAFDHTIGYGNASDLTTHHTLWVTGDFVDVSESDWTQLTIPTYPTGTNWNFVHATVNVPLTSVGAHTVFGFKYDVPSTAANKATWEVKNLQVSVTCEETPSALDETQAATFATKILIGGHMYIVMPNGERYTTTGIKVQ